MEFRYNRKGLIISFLCMVLFGILSLQSIIEISSPSQTKSYESYEGFIKSVFLFAASVIIFRFYYLNYTNIIYVNDEFIQVRSGNFQTTIRWTEIISSKVNFGLTHWFDFPFLYRYRYWYGFFKIVITGDNKQIEIGQCIINIHQLIEFLKGKLGSKLDTTEIPVEFKYKQR